MIRAAHQPAARRRNPQVVMIALGRTQRPVTLLRPWRASRRRSAPGPLAPSDVAMTALARFTVRAHVRTQRPTDRPVAVLSAPARARACGALDVYAAPAE
jgi:hypothetical protein